MELLVATRSAHKVAEIRDILDSVPALRVLDLDEAGISYTAAEETLEPFETFEENAVSKAEYFHGISGMPALAGRLGDRSGRSRRRPRGPFEAVRAPPGTRG